MCVDNFSTIENRKLLSTLTISRNEISLICSDNVGYGAGINIGIRKFAKDNIKFKVLIVCNCDIEILSIPENAFMREGDCIIAPRILTKKGKNQNPLLKFKPVFLLILFSYAQHTNNWMLFRFLTIILRIYNYSLSHLFFFTDQIYAAHGSFIIIPNQSLNKINELFDNDIFLLCEELVLAEKALSHDIRIVYDEAITIRHYEDASMAHYNTNMLRFELWKKAYAIVYSRYIRSNNNDYA